MIELSDNPQDYNVPFQYWWPGQKNAIEHAINLDDDKVLVLEQPTGTGKSGNPATVSYFRPGTATFVSTRDLQSQYASSFDDFAIVWGQEHYPCADPQHIEDYLSIYNDKPSRADCPHRKVGDCQYVMGCEYECAKMHAMSARAKVFNLAYAYYTKWWRRDQRDWDLFCDEAHRLPEALSSLISEDVGDWVRRKYVLDTFPTIKGGLRKHLDLTCIWLESSIIKLLPFTKSKSKSRARDALRAKRLRARLQDLLKTLQQAEPESWYILSTPKRFTARPVIPGDYASRVITPAARSLIFMSATIGNPEVMLAELGLGDREFEFLSLPHIFPLANRPVLWLQGCPRIRYKTTEKEYDRQAEIIANLIKRHSGEKGLIHTASWHYSKALCERLGRLGVGDRVMLAEGKRIETVEKFKRSNNGTVAVSPSWQEGLNFPDDELRFAIIAKCFTDDITLLTPTGEVSMNDVQLGQEVFAWKDGKIVVDEVDDILIQPYKGIVYDYKANGYDLSVTPNHDLLIGMHKKYHKWADPEKKEAQELDNRFFRFILSADWEGRKPPARIDVRQFMPSTAKVYYDAEAKPGHLIEDIPNCFKYEPNTRMHRALLSKLPKDWKPKTGRKCLISERSQSNKFPWDFDYIEFLKLAGWFITEGNVFHNRRYDYEDGWAGETWGFVITQKEGCTLDQIRETLDNLSISYHIHPVSKDAQSTFNVMVNSISLYAAFITWFGKKSRVKKIPPFYLELDKESLRYLFDVLVAGDGHVSSNSIQYTTSSSQLRWNFVELAYKLGYQPRVKWIPRGYRSIWMIRAATRTLGSVRPINKSKHYYEGMVWCVKTKTGTVLAGRNGKWVFTGNCPFMSMADPIVRMRVRAKGGSDWYRWKAALKIVQAAGRGVRHADDWCVTYIADGLFPKVKEYCPEWFEVTRL